MIARGALLPTLDLDASYYAGRDDSMTGSKWDATLNLGLPLFSGGILRGRLDEERSRLKEAEFNLDQINRETEKIIRQMYKAALSSQNQARAYKVAYEKTTKNYQMQLNDYRYGLVNNLDVLSALTSMLDAKRNFDRASIQSQIDKAVLELKTENSPQN
jgi:outer membrane protein TolC